MHQPWRTQATVVLLITLTVIGFLLSFSAIRNILWLMTSAINTAAHCNSIFAYRLVFGLQVFAAFVSVYSVSWNIGSIVRRVRRGG